MERDSGEAAWRRQRAAPTVTIQFGWRTLLAMVALVVAAYLLFRIPHFWLIVLSATVLATAADKPVAAMQRHGVPRPVGILALFVILVGLFTVAAVALIPVVAGDLRALERELPGYTARLEQTASTFSPGEGQQFSLAQLESLARTNAGGLARGVTEIGLEAGRTAFYIFVTLVVAFFLALEPQIMLRAMQRFIPPLHQPRVNRIVVNIHDRIGAWARGQFLIAIIFGALMGIGLRLLGVPYAWSLGVVAGILEVVPYVGGVITVVLASFSAATIGLPAVAGVLVLYAVLVFIESHVLAPLLYGRAVGLPPVAILLGLLAGVELLGILGALLAVPLTVVVWAIVNEFAPAGSDAQPVDAVPVGAEDTGR